MTHVLKQMPAVRRVMSVGACCGQEPTGESPDPAIERGIMKRGFDSCATLKRFERSRGNISNFDIPINTFNNESYVRFFNGYDFTSRFLPSRRLTIFASNPLSGQTSSTR